MSCNCNNLTCPECNNCTGGSNEYLLVKATSSNSCGTITSNTETDCPKQEPTFDTALTGFLIPLKGEPATFKVCNADIYSLGQWLYFSSIGAYVRITAILDGNLTVTSGCENGNDVSGNTYYTQAVSAGSVFNVSGRPSCVEDEENADAMLEDATKICVPSLEEEPLDLALMQVTGRVEENEGDLSFAKCIKRIKNFLWRDGHPIWPAIKEIPYGNYFENEKLAIDASGNVGKLKKVTYPQTLYKHCVNKFISSTPISLFNRGNGPSSPVAVVNTATSLLINDTTFGGLLAEVGPLSGNMFVELRIDYSYHNSAAGERGVDIEMNNEVIARERISGIGVTTGSIIRILQIYEPYPSIPFEFVLFGTVPESSLSISVRIVALYV